MLRCGIRVLVGACAFAGALLLAQAQADEPRYVPPAGTALTYKTIIVTSVRPGQSVTTGMVNTYRVKSSDGVTSDGTVELTTAYSAAPKCEGDACDAFNREMEQLHGRKEGDLYAVDVPPDVTRELAKLSAIRWRYFVRELEDAPIPSEKNGPGGAGFDVVPMFVLSSRMDCDKAALQSFFPLGKSQHVSVSCTESFERSHTRPPMKDLPLQKHEMTLDISYEGQDKVTTPAGEWAVQKIRMVSTRQEPPASSESEILFSEKIGAIVKSHTVSKVGTSGAGSQVDRELIAVSP